MPSIDNSKKSHEAPEKSKTISDNISDKYEHPQ